jgi:hypothetical protein
LISRSRHIPTPRRLRRSFGRRPAHRPPHRLRQPVRRTAPMGPWPCWTI